jgi:hypothetical protein
LPDEHVNAVECGVGVEFVHFKIQVSHVRVPFKRPPWASKFPALAPGGLVEPAAAAGRR